jgi:hypothetical protein
MSADDKRHRPTSPGEARRPRPNPQDAATAERKVLPFPARRSRKQAFEDDGPPGAA